jgi:hypothetical protein
MGLSFGGSQYQGPTRQAKNAGFSLLGAINPQMSGLGNFDNATASFMQDLGFPVGSILQGIPGVVTFDQYGNPQEVGSNNLPTLLPSVPTLQNYDTLFEKADSGALSPTAKGILDNFLGMSQGQGVEDILSTIQSSFESGMPGGIGQLPGMAAPQFNAPPNIGKLTSQILADMPPEFREFTQNVLNAADPESFEQELANFEQKVTTKMFADIDAAGEQSLDVFASEGLGVAGAAMAVQKELALRGVIETNALVASERMKSLQIYTDRLNTGNNLMNILLSAGAQEQANLVAGEVARMNAAAQQEVAKLNASVALQQQAMALRGQQQAILANAAVDLYGINAGLAQAAFGGLLGESQAENAQSSAALMLPYQILFNVGQQNSAKSTQPTTLDFGGIVGAAGALGAAAMEAGPAAVGAAAAPATGGLSAFAGGGLSLLPGWSI